MPSNPTTASANMPGWFIGLFKEPTIADVMAEVRDLKTEVAMLREQLAPTRAHSILILGVDAEREFMRLRAKS